MYNRIKIITGLLFFISSFSYSQIEPIITDRPEITESAVTMPNKFLQIESGFSYSKIEVIKNFHEVSSSFGTLLRFGVFADLELRLGSEFLSVQDPFTKASSNGLAGILFGTKQQIAKGYGVSPDMAVMFHLILPVGNNQFISKKISPEIVFTASQDLSEFITLSTNIGARYNGDNQVLNNLITFSIGFTLSERLGFFAEYFGEFSRGFLPSNGFDFGAAFLINDNFQLDASAGSIPFDANNDFFAGAGVSYRFRL